MIRKYLRSLFVVAFTTFCTAIFSQQVLKKDGSDISALDSLEKARIIFKTVPEKPHIVFTVKQAQSFLQNKYRVFNWKNSRDPLRQAILQLVYFASHNPVDSTEFYFNKYPFDSLYIPWDKFYVWDTLKIKIPVISPPAFNLMSDSLLKSDTSRLFIHGDTLKINTNKISADKLLDLRKDKSKSTVSLKDTMILVIVDTLNEVSSLKPGFPFRYYNYPYEGDSIEVAIRSLIKYLEDRDSSIVNFTGLTNRITPVWLNSRSGKMVRYWLKNEYSDSVAVWIGSTGRNTFGLYTEEGIGFNRPKKQFNISNAKIDHKYLNNSNLQEIRKNTVRPEYWKYRAESLILLNQTSLSNWVKGGENSIATSMDLLGYADYANKLLKISSNNFARFQFGYMKSGTNPMRKNLDLIETNSKLNHKAFGKFDFSTILLFKTQLAHGKNYTKYKKGGVERDTAILVSKFFNPAVVVLGIGLDYKPSKTTSINFSPLSYKGTFVLDTAKIDQTKYGIPKGKTSLNEPGASFMFSNECRPYKNMVLTNRLQMFTNYIHHPQNIDIDWEMIAVINLNWFTDLRLNTRLIFDDDAKTLVLDDSKNPVLRPDGTQKKTARIQFKEIFGVSFSFRF